MRLLVSPEDGFDTAYYTLTSSEKESILKILKSPDTLKSAINPCIMDGLILSLSYEKGNKKHTVRILNDYDDKLFTFIDIANKYIPERFRIRYDKNELIRMTTEGNPVRIPHHKVHRMIFEPFKLMDLKGFTLECKDQIFPFFNSSTAKLAALAVRAI